jgi:uncharacterized membrane protein
MNQVWIEWLSLCLGVLLVALYEIRIRRQEAASPETISRSAHALLRQDWVRATMAVNNSEILAVQTLRNSMMSASITASTSALAMMGLITMTGSLFGSKVLHVEISEIMFPSVKEAILLIMIIVLFFSFVCSTVAVRFYNHVGYMMAMPFNHPLRLSWVEPACAYVAKAGQLYSMSLRTLFSLAPLLLGLVNPMTLLPSALVLIFALRWFDHVAVGRV